MIDEYKQLIRIIAEEINVKEVSYLMAKTEKGDLSLSYFLDDDWIRMKLGDKIVWSDNLEKVACAYLDKVFKKNE
jgi:hypothetical protein